MIGELARFDETGLFYRVPDPTEEQIDALDPGTAVAAEEEANYFKSRAWTGVVDGRECRCIEFRTERLDVIGYVAFQVVPKKHPTRRSREERDYLFLYHLSVERRFQGAEDTSARHVAKWAVEILALIDSLAEADDCVGVYLNVREDNIPARRRYEEAGYAADGSYVQSRTGRRMLRMRKVF